MIKTQDLSFQYSSSQRALQFPNINLGSEENLLILGKSGVGKTTLLHLVAGLLKPHSGSVIIGATALQTLSARARDRFIGQHIGLVFQKNYAVRSLNVMQNLEARLFFSGKKVDKGQLASLLEQLDLKEQRHKKVHQLSEGQRQRLGIALAVVHEPRVLLADEPTSSLDDENCEIVMQLLLKQAKLRQANLVVITHDARVKNLFKNKISL